MVIQCFKKTYFIYSKLFKSKKTKLYFKNYQKVTNTETKSTISHSIVGKQLARNHKILLNKRKTIHSQLEFKNKLKIL